MALNLGAKISAAAVIPSIAFLLVSAIMIKTNLNEMNGAGEVYTNMQFVQANSAFIHEIQKERAKSVAYNNGATTREDLDAQRAQADAKFRAFSETLKKVTLDQSLFSNASKAVDYHFNTTRRQIGGKEIPTPEVIQRFASLIAELLNAELAVADNSHLLGISDRIRSVNIIEAAKENAGKTRANMAAIVSSNKPLTDAQFTNLTSMKAGVDANLMSPGLVMSREGQKKLESFRSQAHWAKVDWFFQTILKKADTGNYNEDPKEVIKVTTQQIDDISTVVNGELDNIYNEIIQRKSDSTRTVWMISAFILGVSIFLIGFLYFIVRAITVPINRVINNLRGSGSEVASASEQLQSVSQQLSSGATEAAASLEETVSSLEALAAKVKLNADHSQEASALSQASRSSAEEGESEIRRLITAMTEISQSSKKIEEIINVIDDIAFQTNLLALNAAVEAARAGEQGRGFSVVAEAVRNLAQRSASAAKEITTLIKDSVSQIENGSKIAGNSGTVLKNIVTGVKKVADLNTEIAMASQDQATGIAELNKAMNQLDQTTQSNAASAEEASASAEEMSAQAIVLQNLVGELAVVVDGKDTGGTVGSPAPVLSASHSRANAA